MKIGLSTAAVLLAPPFFLFSQSNSAGILESWKAAGSPYHMVNEAGVRRRLIKATLELPALKTLEALNIAQAHAEKDAIPGLKREVEKARRRLQYRK